jgi:hypothetical protein
MTVEEAIAEAAARGLKLFSLRQDEGGLWVAGLNLNGGHGYIDRADTASAAIMKVADNFPQLGKR